MKASRFFTALCALGMLASAADGAELPAKESTASDSSNARKYAFELQTFNQGEKVRRGQGGLSGARIQIDIASAMTDDELASVTEILDELAASQADAAGYRCFSLPNGTRVKIGGFEDPASGVQSLPVEFTVANEFATPEASLVLQIAAAGNLFVVSPVDPELVATTARVDDRSFQRRHKRVAITPDANALAEWVQKNISPVEVPAN